MTERIFICLPELTIRNPKDARKETSEYVENTRIVARYAFLNGCNPFAPILYYPQFMSYFHDLEKFIGRDPGGELLEFCDWLWIFPRAEYPQITERMRIVIDRAEKLGIKKYWFWHDEIEKMKDYLHYYDIIMNWNTKK